LSGVEVGATTEVEWDGSDDNGRVLKPSVYVLVLESSGAGGKIWREKGVLRLAKGL